MSLIYKQLHCQHQQSASGDWLNVIDISNNLQRLFNSNPLRPSVATLHNTCAGSVLQLFVGREFIVLILYWSVLLDAASAGWCIPSR